MSKKAFDKIAAGLTEALEIARGNAKPTKIYVPPEINIEVWHKDRKVTVYENTVLRIWGNHMVHEMSDEPTTMESVQAAFDWLYVRS